MPSNAIQIMPEARAMATESLDRTVDYNGLVYTVKATLPTGTSGKVAVRVRVAGSLRSANLYAIR